MRPGRATRRAGRRALDTIRFLGDAFVTDTDTICKLWNAGVRT
jgi:hypothetical protein